MPLAGRLHSLLVSATSPCIAVLLVERMCVRPLIAGRDNQNGHLAPHQHGLSCLDEHTTNSVTLVVACHGQRHYLAITTVTLVERPHARSDEADDMFAVPCDKRCVVVVTQDRFESLVHLCGRCGIAQGAHESSESDGIRYCGASYRNTHWNYSFAIAGSASSARDARRLAQWRVTSTRWPPPSGSSAWADIA